MTSFQETTFTKNVDKKKFDINSLNFKNLGIKFKGSGKITTQNTFHDDHESKPTVEGNKEVFETKMSRRKSVDDRPKEEILDDQNIKILNKTVENLRIALLEKNEEIAILKKNFKEKINLIENENKKQIEAIDTKYKLHIDNLINTYEAKIKETEARHSEYLAEFDQNYSKFQKEVRIFVSNHVEKSLHEEMIRKINMSWTEKLDNLKSLFNKKLKEMMNFFDKPEYRVLMEKLKFYSKFKDKINVDLDDKEKSSLLGLKNDEIEILITKMKIHVIDVETEYVKGLTDLEQKYQEYEAKFQQSKADDKLENLKKLVMDKFSLLENINILGNDDNQLVIPHKNSSEIILNLLNEFKDKKKLFSQNLEVDFNFTTSFIKEYDNKNKEMKNEEIKEKESFKRQATVKKQPTEIGVQKKLSMFSSEIDQNPVYEEENFTMFDYPKILVNPHLKHFGDFKSAEENIFETSNNGINTINENRNLNEISRRESEDYIRLKTKK